MGFKDKDDAKKYNRAYYLSRREGWNNNNTPEYRRLVKYGLTGSDFAGLLAQQGGRCAICLVELDCDTASWKRPNAVRVDHDHDTGAVRGLLCKKCNTGLGQFCDNEDLLVKAGRYLHERTQ
jgi:hypothetical protein